MQKPRGRHKSLRMDTVAAFGPCKLRGPEEPLLARGPGKPHLLFQATCCLLLLPALDAWGAGRRNYFPELQLGEGQLATLYRLPSSGQASPAVSSLSSGVLQMLGECFPLHGCIIHPMSLLCSP